MSAECITLKTKLAESCSMKCPGRFWYILQTFVGSFGAGSNEDENWWELAVTRSCLAAVFDVFQHNRVFYWSINIFKTLFLLFFDCEAKCPFCVWAFRECQLSSTLINSSHQFSSSFDLSVQGDDFLITVFFFFSVCKDKLCKNGGKCEGADYIFSCRCPDHARGVHCETSKYSSCQGLF